MPRKLLAIILFSSLLALIPLSVVWIHHQFVAGLNPLLGAIAMLFMLAAAVFSYRLLFKVAKKYIRFTPAALFATGSCSYLACIVMLQSYYRNSAADIHLHDTYFVMPFSFPPIFAVAVFAVFAAIYHWFFNLFKKQMNIALGYIHFWVTFLSTCFLQRPIWYIRLAGMPRRYYSFSNAHAVNALHHQSILIFVGIFLLIAAQLLFVYNFFNSTKRPAK